MNTDTEVLPTGQELEILKFIVKSNPYAIDVKQVREIIQIDRISAVPNAGKMISGISLVRGDVVTVIDLKHILEKIHTMGVGSRTTLLCEFNGTKVAFLVDEVIGINRVKWDQVVTPDAILNADLIAGTINLDNSIVMMLNIEKIFSDCMAD